MMVRLALLASALALCPARAEAAPPSTRAAADATATFGVSLYQQVRDHKGNLFFSPVSLLSAMGLAASGARGETLAQMNKALHLPEEGGASALAPLMRSLTERTGKGTKTLLASGLWSRKGARLEEEFLRKCKAIPNAALAQADFEGRPDEARRAINAWVEKNTEGRVKDLLPAGSVTRETKMILASAIHFKGDWAHPFRKDLTKEGDFRAPGGKVKVPFMHQRMELPYRQGPSSAMLELPFAGGEASMAFLLPAEKVPLEDLEKALTAEKLAGWLRDLKEQKVEVYLPRFRIAAQMDLKGTFSAMGMPLAFSPRADFSGMAAEEKARLSDVFHRAYVDVNEKGSEAGAATAAGVTPKAAGPRMPVFRADRPFLFLILDRKTGCILFLGRYMQPKVS
jgi:serpin B